MIIVKSTTLFSDSADDIKSPIRITETRIFGLIVYRRKVFKSNSNTDIIFPIDI